MFSLKKLGAFWRDPVTEAPQARMILRWAGWPLILAPAASLIRTIMATTDTPTMREGAAIGALIALVPALFLVFRASRIAAITLLLLSLMLATAIPATMAIHPMAQGLLKAFLIFASVVWYLLAYVQWRAFRSATLLARLKSRPQAPLAV